MATPKQHQAVLGNTRTRVRKPVPVTPTRWKHTPNSCSQHGTWPAVVVILRSRKTCSHRVAGGNYRSCSHFRRVFSTDRRVTRLACGNAPSLLDADYTKQDAAPGRRSPDCTTLDRPWPTALHPGRTRPCSALTDEGNLFVEAIVATRLPNAFTYRFQTIN